jgi:adenine specific DNA methylase Mod
VIEEIAYRDTWGKGADSFIAMIYERLKLMHELLAEDGSIYVHCDWRVNSALYKVMLDEIFGKDNFQSEIIWSNKEKCHGFKARLIIPYVDTQQIACLLFKNQAKFSISNYFRALLKCN